MSQKIRVIFAVFLPSFAKFFRQDSPRFAGLFRRRRLYGFFWKLSKVRYSKSGVLIRTFGFSDNSARLGQNSLGSAFGRTNPQISLGHLSDNRTVRTVRPSFRTLGPSRADLVLFRTFGSFGQLGQSRAELVTEFRDKF